MNIPSDLRYTKDHEWVKYENGVATVGITDFAQSELGDVIFVELPKIGRAVKQGEQLSVVESTKAASDVYAPVGGSVIEVNPALANKPELVNSNPFTEGWMVKLGSVSESDLANLMAAEEYRKLVEH